MGETDGGVKGKSPSGVILRRLGVFLASHIFRLRMEDFKSDVIVTIHRGNGLAEDGVSTERALRLLLSLAGKGHHGRASDHGERLNANAPSISVCVSHQCADLIRIKDVLAMFLNQFLVVFVGNHERRIQRPNRNANYTVDSAAI